MKPEQEFITQEFRHGNQKFTITMQAVVPNNHPEHMLQALFRLYKTRLTEMIVLDGQLTPVNIQVVDQEWTIHFKSAINTTTGASTIQDELRQIVEKFLCIRTLNTSDLATAIRLAEEGPDFFRNTVLAHLPKDDPRRPGFEAVLMAYAPPQAT